MSVPLFVRSTRLGITYLALLSLSGRCRRREQTIAHLLKVWIPDPSKSMITGWDQPSSCPDVPRLALLH